MSFPASTPRDDAGSSSRSSSADHELQLDALRPLLAGAHARGMADALELAGATGAGRLSGLVPTSQGSDFDRRNREKELPAAAM